MLKIAAPNPRMITKTIPSDDNIIIIRYKVNGQSEAVASYLSASLAGKYVTTAGTEGLIVCHQTFTVSVVGRMLFDNLISRKL